jgi:4-amino-4-deoxychorismate lyase
MKIPVLSRNEVYIKNQELNPKRPYLAMYRSDLNGIVTDPDLMFVPIDDHIVHRGDGVFEAIKCIDGKIYALERHLDRLFISAQTVGLKIPFSKTELFDICTETTSVGLQAQDQFLKQVLPDPKVKMSSHQEVQMTGGGRAKSFAGNCLLRLFVSRGPGSFTPNPYDTLGERVYLVITKFAPVSEEKYRTGVTAAASQIEVKAQFYAQVKSCNYLPNVMMKKEAVDRGVDFSIGIDENGYVAEGPTENFAMISNEGHLVVPEFSRILRGVTLLRIMEFTEQMQKSPEAAKKWLSENFTVQEALLLNQNSATDSEKTFRGSGKVEAKPILTDICNLLRGVQVRKFSKAEILSAQEAFMVGTTLDVLPVVKFDAQTIGDGRVGPISKLMRALLQKDEGGAAVFGMKSLASEVIDATFV